MGVVVVEDANGVRSVLVSTSEPRGYLRLGVSLQEREKAVVGTDHAEADIVSYANANGLKVVGIGATRPVCASCQNVIESSGVNVSTPLKPLPKAKQ
jgi:filamentous hemagglutinin